MKGLSAAALLCSSFALGIPSACVVENNPPPPTPVAVRPLLVPVADAAIEAASTPEPAALVTAPSPPQPLLVCAADSDCVAVPRNGCCNNGYKEAVNAASVAAYQASFVCPEPHPICPMFRIRDDRVPVCNVTTHLCELVKR
jgi:hypothetical protein